MAVHAQEAKTPPAYLIAETDVTDRAAFQKYAEKVPETLAPFRGSFHYVVRGGKTQALEGQPPKSIVVLAFDKYDQNYYTVWRNPPSTDVWGVLPLKVEGKGDNKTFTVNLRGPDGKVAERQTITLDWTLPNAPVLGHVAEIAYRP